MFAVDERTTLNLLLLGETGTGKSTWINAFANYISFESLTDAKDAGGLFPIRTTFNVINPKTIEEQIISTDKEVLPSDGNAGQSVTQTSRTYSFTHGAMTVNVIDTPGLSSTEDALTETHDTDKQHVENILHFIGRFDKLHAICILLKPNQSRITKGFAYCITEILRNLHESASKNVIFIITNAKSTDFMPGNTLSTLKTFLRRNSLERLKLSEDTIFYVENDTVKHIVEHINECSHNQGVIATATPSWEKSVKATRNMITYIQNLQPHDVNGMQCIYNTRRLVGILSNLLLDIVKCCETNLETLENKRQEISMRQQEIKTYPKDFIPRDLRDMLNTKRLRIEVKRLGHSNTICKSPKCTVIVGYDRHFPQICCEHCTGFIHLWTCRAFGGIFGARCKHCACERDKHEWQATKTEVIREKFFDSSEQNVRKILNRDDALRELNAHCTRIEQSIHQIENERKQMLETGAITSVFLEQNVLLSGSTSDNLGACLRNEYEAFKHASSKTHQEKTIRHIARAPNARGDLNKDIRVHATDQHSYSLLKLIGEYDKYYKKASSSGKIYTMPEVCKMIDVLYNLPENGKTLKV